MTVEIPEQLESAVKQQANARGLSPDTYIREVLQRELEASHGANPPVIPFKDSFGILAKYGPAPSAEEIDENRADMLRGSIFALDAE